MSRVLSTKKNKTLSHLKKEIKTKKKEIKQTKRKTRKEILMSFKYRQPVIYLYDYIEKEIIVTFIDGREIEGKLISYDDLFNLYMVNCIEHLHDITRKDILTGETRQLGEVFCKGQNIMDIMLKEGYVKE